MAKFYGKVGFIFTEETSPSVWTSTVEERKYVGDVTRNTKRWDTTTQVNDNININNTISIVMDPYAQTHFFAIGYVEWAGVLWKVTSIEVQHPRLILSIGGVYNGPTPEA